MNLTQRVEKAARLTMVETSSQTETSVGTWGSEDDFYKVTLTKSNEAQTMTIDNRPVKLETIFAECLKDEGLFSDDTNCKGNSNHSTICYHVMGAVQFVLGNRSKEITFCKDQFVAEGNLKWHGGHLALIRSKQGSGKMWAVIRDKPKSVNHGDLETRVNSLRGSEEEEEGID